MNDASWKALTTAFPRALKGARFDDAAPPPLDGRQPPFICGAFSPDEELLALSGGGRIPSRPAIWIARVPSLESALTLRGHQGVHALAWDAKTSLLASASNDYTCALWDLARRDHLFVCGGDDEPVVKGHVAFARDALYVGETEAFAGREARLLRASLETGRLEAVDAPRGAVLALAVDAEERWAIAVGDFHDLGPLTLVTKDAPARRIEGELHALGWRDGSPLLAASDDEGLRIETAGAAVRAGDAPEKAAFSPDGRALALAEGTRVRVVDVTSGETQWSLDVPSPTDDALTTLLVWSPTASRLAVAGFDRLALIDARTGTLEKAIAPPRWFR